MGFIYCMEDAVRGWASVAVAVAIAIAIAVVFFFFACSLVKNRVWTPDESLSSAPSASFPRGACDSHDPHVWNCPVSGHT
ncbi:hypothetical protein NL676_028207 [Syzygium grande]|nr:hypothetical protein NL676_028207 [Syzygium grande]